MAACNFPLAWTGLYRKDYDLATPESMAHPAKASWDLAFKILDHLQELGLLKDGATVLDPMAGTGRFLLAACAKGFKAIAVELEPKFIKMLEDNKAYASKKLCLPGFELPLSIIQGDARNLSELLKERGLICVSSPPYFQGQDEGNDSTISIRGRNALRNNYGSTPGQIGRLPDKPIAITSPPWNLQSGGRGEASRQSTPDEGLIDRHGGGIKGGTGDSPGNISNLPDRPIAITSPPYEDTEKRDRGKEASHASEADHPRGDRNISQGIQGSEGNIGSLPARPLTAITSPPYEDAQKGGGISARMRGEGNYPLTTALPGNLYQPSEAGQAKGQISREQGQTYLEAMALVYAEIAKVADVLVVVVKNPTRNGKLRRLDLDTITLLEATGWKLYCQHRAILFEEQEMGHLFEGQVKKPRGRLSFFKRLSYRKGSIVADHEDILICIKS